MPFKLHSAECVDVARNDILASVSGSSAKEDDFGFTYLSDCVAKASQRYLSEGVDLLKLLSVSCHNISNNVSVECKCEFDFGMSLVEYVSKILKIIKLKMLIF